MIKINKHIEIVSSSKISLSSMSRESRGAIYRVLSANYSHVRITIIDDFNDLKALVRRKPDLVFLGMKFIPIKSRLGRLGPDKLWLSKYLADRGIAHIGSDHRAHQLEFNKPLAKRRIADNGGATAAFRVAGLDTNSLSDQPGLNFPLFIKPVSGGGGSGIDVHSMALNMAQAEQKIQSIGDTFGSASLVEEYLDGREFSVAILRSLWTDNYSVMPIELVAPADMHGVRVLSSRVKTLNRERVSKITDLGLKKSVSALAIKAFEALGANDYGRIDIRLNDRGEPQFLEANLLPSLIEGYGSFPKACHINEQLAFEPMVMQITSLGLEKLEHDVAAPVSRAVVISP